MSEFKATAVRRILSTPTQVRTDLIPTNRDVHRRHPRRLLYVDSGHLTEGFFDLSDDTADLL